MNSNNVLIIYLEINILNISIIACHWRMVFNYNSINISRAVRFVLSTWRTCTVNLVFLYNIYLSLCIQHMYDYRHDWKKKTANRRHAVGTNNGM